MTKEKGDCKMANEETQIIEDITKTAWENLYDLAVICIDCEGYIDRDKFLELGKTSFIIKEV